ncbi:MAG TPA: hypothetical protein VGM24_01625 [Puia sp.]
MKFALLALITVLSFSACKKTTVVNETVDQAYSAIYTIDPADWVQGQDPGSGNFFYSSTLTIPELDDIINTHGGVQVYISFDDLNAATKTYESLPEVFDGVAYGTLHSTGSVTIDLRDAGGGSLTSPITQSITAKVVLIDAQPLDN